MECDHQTDNAANLQKHLEQAHKTTKSNLPFKCKDCAQEFSVIWSLMNQRRDTHGKSKKKCRNRKNNMCKYEANDGEECWYDHSDVVGNPEGIPELNNYNCRICNIKFSSKTTVLTHRKSEHNETVPECHSLKENKECEYGDKCRFRHERIENHIPTDHAAEKNPNNIAVPNNTNFWEAPKGTKPPDQLMEIKNMIDTMMMDICLLKKKVSTQ